MDAIEIRLPELSASSTTAAVLAWRKAPGDRVAKGEVLVELETDKSSVDLESEHSGVLLEILVPAGSEDVAVGTALARLAVGDEVEAEPPRATRAAAPAPVPPTLSRFAAPAGARSQPAPAVRSAPRAGHATPLARRMAAQAGLDLEALRGTGPEGRVTKGDVEAALGIARSADPAQVIALPTAIAPGPPVALAPPASLPPPADTGSWRDERLSTARRQQAARLAEAKRSVPHFYLEIECDLERALALRAELVASADRPVLTDVPRPTVTDLLVRALALALRGVPEANVAWADAALRVFDDVDVAVAVASERGLVTPVVRGADRLGLGALARTLRDLTGRARAGKLRPEEYRGGTTTLSNLGTHGVLRLWPILNPPQATILGVGAATPRPSVVDGALAVRTRASVTLSGDHRALDGATGARLLEAFRELLEHPLQLLL